MLRLFLYGYVRNDPVDWVDFKGLYEGDEFTDLSPPFDGLYSAPPTPRNGSTYYGGEGHFFLGAGLINLNCKDECGQKTISFYKICFGGAIGFSGGGGLVQGTNGPNCKADRYKGWFYEIGASYGYGSAGMDIGYKSDGPFGLPGSLSGVVEAGGGAGIGAKFKSTWCYYNYIPL